MKLSAKEKKIKIIPSGMCWYLKNIKYSEMIPDGNSHTEKVDFEVMQILTIPTRKNS